MNDDLDEEIIDSEEGFDDEFSQGENLGDNVRQNPLVKIGIVVAAILGVVVVLMLFSGEAVEEQVSQIPGGSAVTSVPGTDDKVSPAYQEAVEQQNEADLERAISQGESAIPVPVKTQETRLEVPEAEEKAEDPLHRWRMLQEERVEREMKTRQTESEPVTVLNAEQQSEAIATLSQSMMEQMSALLEANDSVATALTTVTLIEYEEEAEEGAGAGGYGGGPTPGGGDISEFEEEVVEEVIIPAGKIVYGQMLLEANSDVPSVVLAQMVSGPLKGWKLLGEFETLTDLEMLAITFDTAVNEKGDQYEISAIMLNPDTGLGAHVTDVDHRYFRRIVLPAASAFLEGFASAIAETDSSVITIEGGQTVEDTEEADTEQEIALGVEEAFSEITEIVDDLADVPVRIILGAGTPIAIFFSENVVKDGST